MQYKVVADQDVFELNPELKAIAEFKDLTSRQMEFVILTADRKTPYRRITDEKQKRERAVLAVGYGMEGNRPDRNARALISGKVESVEKAITKYRELQPDENQQSLDSTKALIHTYREFINNVNNKSEEQKKDKQYGKDVELAGKFAKQLPELEEARLKLEQILDVQDDFKPEITTYSHLDVPEEALNTDLNAIEIFNQQQRDSSRQSNT